MSKPFQFIVMLAAAIFEVGGDALIRHGLRNHGRLAIFGGMLVLASYGLCVNLVPMDFSRLLGVYVGVFALVSVTFGVFVFGEAVARNTWIGLIFILAGSAIIQFQSAN